MWSATENPKLGPCEVVVLVPLVCFFFCSRKDHRSYLISAVSSFIPPMDTADVEGGSSSIIFVLLGAFVAFILLSRTERTEPDVSKQMALHFIHLIFIFIS